MINKTMIQALKRLYDRSPSGHQSYLAFRRTAYYSTLNGCMMVHWCDMWIGIEYDGYTHS